MKHKKLMKRIIESRGGKKAAKKVRKRNRKFLDNLQTMALQELEIRDFVNDSVSKISKRITERAKNITDTIEERGKAIVCDKLNTKQDMLKYVKDVIASSNTTLDEEMVSATPVKSFELGVFTFTFYNNENPYRVLVSKDININNLKTIKAEVVVEKTDVDKNVDEN